MARLRYDNSLGTLGASLDSSGTTITFATAPDFETITGSDYIELTLDPPVGSAPNASFEIVYLTAYTATDTTGTILRGQEGTTGVDHTSGAVWVNAPTVEDFVSISIQSAVTPFATQAGGDLTVSAGNAQEIAALTGGPGTGGFDLTLTGLSDGDVVLVGWTVTPYSFSDGGMGLDIATIVSGSPVTWLGQSAGEVGSVNDGLSWAPGAVASNTVTMGGGPLLYVVQSDDLDSGTLTLRPYCGTAGSGHIARSAGSGPLIFSAVAL